MSQGQLLPPEVVEKVRHLPETYHLRPIRVVWYLARRHDIKISDAGVYRILTRNGVSRLPRGTRLRKVYTIGYQKQVPGHQIQVDAKFPFCIKEVRTDNGNPFQATFQWHVEDKGIRHDYIRPNSPQLNGKVERSHRADEQELYPLLTSQDDLALNIKPAEWESFYNLSRPHNACDGTAPYEILRERP